MTASTGTPAIGTTIELANGVKMPMVALGTAPQMTGDEDSSHFNPLNSFAGFLPEQAYRSVHALLEMKDKKTADDNDDDSDKVPVHIDTALFYRSHPQIRQVMGNAFATGEKQRSGVFLTTKVFHPYNPFGGEDLGTCMPSDPECEMTYEDVYRFVYRQFQQSLHECGVGYFDLVLLHWPGRSHPKTNATINAQHRLAAWHVLEDCYAKGWTRAIGVSNFSEHHLEELQSMNEASKTQESTNVRGSSVAVRPHVNQIEASVFLQYQGIREYCLAHGIVTAAFSPLGRGVMHVAENETVHSIATKHGKDAGQVAMKYLLQKGYGCVVFWTTNVQRIASNHELHDFHLDESELEALDALNRSDGSGTWGLVSPYEIP